MDPNKTVTPSCYVGPVCLVIFALKLYEQADVLSLSGSTFTVRFPASSGTLLYDPTLELTLIPKDDEFWRHPWFIWTTSSLGALVSELTALCEDFVVHGVVGASVCCGRVKCGWQKRNSPASCYEKA